MMQEAPLEAISLCEAFKRDLDFLAVRELSAASSAGVQNHDPGRELRSQRLWHGQKKKNSTSVSHC